MPHRGIVLPPPILLPFPYHLSCRRPFLRCPWNPPSFVNHHHHFILRLNCSPPRKEEETSFQFLPLPRYHPSSPPSLPPLSPTPSSCYDFSVSPLSPSLLIVVSLSQSSSSLSPLMYHELFTHRSPLPRPPPLQPGDIRTVCGIVLLCDVCSLPSTKTNN